MFGAFVRDRLQTLPFAQPVYLPNAANGCCYCLVEAGGERTFLSIHGAEYSFDPAWMARYAAERYAYGYVCGLEIEEKTGGLLADYLKTAPIDRILYAPGTQAPVIATLGRHGARVLAEDGALLTVPGQPVERVADTIGAGDAHAGAVLLGLSRGLSLPDAVALGNRVSAQVVQTAGATLSDEALSRVLSCAKPAV